MIDPPATLESIVDLLIHAGDLPGVGVDIEAVARFREMDARLFSAEELADCSAQADSMESRAGRWCAKEAVSKACAKYLQLSLREIQVRSERSGRPIVVLPDRANKLGLKAEVSIAHTHGFAVAVAVAAVGQSPREEISR